MAKTFGLLTLAQPTGLSLVLADGGSLAANTTYYYKIFAVRNDTSAYTVSPRSETASITTSLTQKSVQLTWTAIPGYSPTANASNSYAVLRDTADDFADNRTVMMRNGSAADRLSVATTSYLDTGVNVMACCIDWKDGLPTILVGGGTSGDKVLMWDIYQADVAAGWGRVKPAVDTTWMRYDVDKKTGGAWIVHANLKIGWDTSNVATTTYFDHINGPIIVYGSVITGQNAYVYFGRKINTYDGSNFYPVQLIVHGGATWMAGSQLNGVVAAYGLRCMQGGYQWGGGYLSFGQPYMAAAPAGLTGSEFFDCDWFPTGNGLSLNSAGTFRGNRFGGAAFYSTPTVITPKLTEDEGIGLRHSNNVTVQEPTSTFSQYDVIWRTLYTATIIDGSFQSHGQVDNRPWLTLGYANTTDGSLTFKTTLTLAVQDESGNVLSGVAVTVRNAAGTTVASGTTDANGEYSAGQLTNYVLTPTAALNGVWRVAAAAEQTHIDNGYLTRALHTPHTVTFSQAGYRTRTVTYRMDRKRAEVEMLEAIPAPVAQFSADNTDLDMAAPTVQFANHTDEDAEDSVTYLWNFGDTEVSTDSNPAHTYTAAGTYTVTLTATGVNGADTETKTNYITVSEIVPVVTVDGALSAGTSLAGAVTTAVSIEGEVD